MAVAIDVYTAQVLPQWKDRITSPPGPSSPNLVNTEGICLDSQSYDYLIPQVDGRIVVGGAGQMFWHKRVEWLDNVLDDELVWGAAACFEKYIQKHFRGWRRAAPRRSGCGQALWTTVAALCRIWERFSGSRGSSPMLGPRAMAYRQYFFLIKV
ncbi:hypothetical protein ColLi_06513 [Colletotrichum liriopes]|uniref:Uncharacterized protein n=1 Tax=Colletotrichum liriopes TaxID=708192 RepID=A0AA37GMI7_9PEZI|nr:hypothetical protein ColLi_06513 [Colletotrichum liriopes]